MDLNRIDLIVSDMPAATAFFRDVVGLSERFAEERFAEFDAGADARCRRNFASAGSGCARDGGTGTRQQGSSPA